MGRQELEAALRREGDEQVRQLWQQLEAEAAELRRETTVLLEREEQGAHARLEAETAAIRESARSAALQQAQQARLQSEQRLAERLRQLAEARLTGLATSGGPALFSALAAEIPEHRWSRVTVHPRDVGIAGEQYPEAEILSSDRLSGGLKVENPEGRTVIINSLEKRLEHLWPELLPEILREVWQMVGEP